MKTSKSLITGMFLSMAVGAWYSSVQARDLSSKIAPSEAVYCREKNPDIDQDMESWIPAVLSPDDTFIDVEERCNDDPQGLEEARKLWPAILGGHF